MTLLQLAQEASGNPEPIVVGGLVAGAGVVLLWFANRFMKMLSMVQSLVTAVFGDPNSPVPNGVVRKLEGIDHRLKEHTGQFDLHVQTEEQWQRDMYGAIHRWNENVLTSLTDLPVAPAALQLPPPIERRKKPR